MEQEVELSILYEANEGQLLSLKSESPSKYWLTSGFVLLNNAEVPFESIEIFFTVSKNSRSVFESEHLF